MNPNCRKDLFSHGGDLIEKAHIPSWFFLHQAALLQTHQYAVRIYGHTPNWSMSLPGDIETNRDSSPAVFLVFYYL